MYMTTQDTKVNGNVRRDPTLPHSLAFQHTKLFSVIQYTEILLFLFIRWQRQASFILPLTVILTLHAVLSASKSLKDGNLRITPCMYM